MVYTAPYSFGNQRPSYHVNIFTNEFYSPPPGAAKPFSQITNNSRDLAVMNRLEYNPTLVMLSDWDHFTSEEYAAAERNSNLDLLSVSSLSSSSTYAHSFPVASTAY